MEKPATVKQTTMDYFRNKAEEWDSPAKIEMAEKFVNELLKIHTPSPDKKVLDFGTGTGLVGMKLSGKVREVVYLDSSESMLEILKKKLDANKDWGRTIIHGDITSYNQRDIDLVTTLMALHHIENIDETINYISDNILKPSGVLVIGDLTEEDGSFHNGDAVPHKGFKIEELKAKLEKTGFELITSYVYNTMVKGDKKYDQFIMVAVKSDKK